MTTNRRGFVFGAAALPTLAMPAFAKGRYDEGATDADILRGNTSPHSGPASS